MSRKHPADLREAGLAASGVKAVIFDLDGCLVDSEPLSLEAIASEMRSLGIADAKAGEIGDRFLGVAMQEISAYVADRLGKPVPADFAEKVETRLLATYRTKLRTIPGTTKLLTSLQAQGCALAVASGGSRKRIAATLELSGLSPWFAGTTSSAEEVERGKPAPDLFHLALKRLGMMPADCIVVEDSPHGVAGAVEAGLPVIGFVGGSHLEQRQRAHAKVLREAGAIEVFETLDDVERFVSAQVGSAGK